MVGVALAAELRSAGYDHVISLSRRDADLTDPAQAEAAIAAARPEVVYHIAARVHGLGGNLRTQGEVYLENIRINTNVVEAARRCEALKVVAMGSTAVYSDEAPRPMREADLWIGAPHGSEAGYSHAKRAMLAQLEAYRDQYGMDYAFCIATNLFGPHDRFDEQTGHVIPSLLSKFERGARTGEPVSIWGSGRAQRDFLFVADAARAIRLVGEDFTGAVNIASGAPLSIAAVVEMLVQVTGFTGQIVWDREKPDGQMSREYDISRLRSLGWVPAFGLTDGLQRTFKWLLQNTGQARR